MKRHMVTLASVVFSISVWGTASAQTAVTECGQIVEGEAYLTGDLDCTGFHGGLSGAAIHLGRRGRLDLRGFTITGGEWGVDCVEPSRRSENPSLVPRCEIFDSVGGGMITGANNGIAAIALDIRNLTLSNNGTNVIEAHKLVARNVTISGNAGGVTVGPRGARIFNSTITGNGESGVLGRRVKVFDSVVSDNGGDGITGTSVSLRNVEVTGNGGDGVYAYQQDGRGGRVGARDSVITGNCLTDPYNCSDIHGSYRRARVRNTTYGTCSGCR